MKGHFGIVIAIVLAALFAPHTAHSASPAPTVAIAESNLPFENLADLARLRKDQFEKQAEFDNRRCAALAQLLGAAAGKPITIRPKDTRIRFDADKQRFELESGSRAPGPDVWRGGKEYSGGLYLDVASRESHGTSYVGQNAYGVTRKVMVRESQYVVLSMPKKSMTESNVRASLPTKTADARALQGDLGFEITTQLKRPCVYFESHREDPTVQSPIQERASVYEVHIDRQATSWRIIRLSTGETLRTGKP